MENFGLEANETEITIDLKKYIALFWQWAWLIILVGIVAALAAFIISRQITPVYEAVTTVLVNEAPGSQSSDYQSLLASERLTKTYAEMMTKNPVLKKTIENLGLALEVKEMRGMITVSPVTNTQLINVVVESTDPKAAALIGNTVVDVFRSEIEDVQSDRYSQSKESLETKLEEVESEIENYNALAASAESETDRVEYYARANQYRETYYSLMELYENVWMSEAQTISSVAVVEPAIVPEAPVRPRVLMNTALAAVVGVLLAAGVILIREALDDTLHTPEEVKNNLNLPVLGAIESFYKNENDKHLITMDQPRSPITESFRALRENIRFASIDHDLLTLLVTSPEPGEGKSTMAANLAVVFAQAGVNTILIDSDLRKPTQHTYFDISNRNGLSNILYQRDEPFDQETWHSPIDDLRVIPCGSIPPNPAELLGSNRMKQLLAEIKTHTDLIILDSPPIQVVSDALSLAPEVDGVILVIQPGKTHTTAAKQTVEQLRRAKAQLLGVVLNPLDLKRSQYAYRYAYKNGRTDYHGYYSEAEGDISAESSKP